MATLNESVILAFEVNRESSHFHLCQCVQILKLYNLLKNNQHFWLNPWLKCNSAFSHVYCLFHFINVGKHFVILSQKSALEIKLTNFTYLPSLFL